MVGWDTEVAGYVFETGDESQDELFEVLSHSHRRFVLRYLREVGTAVSVDDLTSELVAWRTESGVGDPSDGNVDSLRVSLLHRHLPKMADAGFVIYDEDTQEVALGDRTEELKYHLAEMSSQ